MEELPADFWFYSKAIREPKEYRRWTAGCVSYNINYRHVRYSIMLVIVFLSAYEKLLEQLQSGEASSGDSFYVRVNMSLPVGSGGSLTVSCNNILHVTNTRPDGADGSWSGSHVHPCQLLDLQSGTVPNYYRLVSYRPTCWVMITVRYTKLKTRAVGWWKYESPRLCSQALTLWPY